MFRYIFVMVEMFESYNYWDVIMVSGRGFFLKSCFYIIVEEEELILMLYNLRSWFMVLLKF